MIAKEKLKDYAHKLMFDMKEEEYDTLQEEFEITIKQMDLIAKIPDIEKITPLSFPFVNTDAKLREDKQEETLTINEILANTKHQIDDQVKIPKVVE